MTWEVESATQPSERVWHVSFVELVYMQDLSLMGWTQPSQPCNHRNAEVHILWSNPGVLGHTSSL